MSDQLEFAGVDELIVDNFAGGGGASLGIEWAFGRSPDIAINHDREAVAMHTANHPHTQHYCEDVWHIDPVKACDGRPVGLAWFSPDCKHFSKAKGGKPVSKKIRGLAWIVVKWARRVRPRVIMLENVEEFQDWGPLIFKRDESGAYVLDRSGNPVLTPCPERKSHTFERWVSELSRVGYAVEWRLLRACDYGAPTIRQRLFLIARRDGFPIIWPKPTHADPNKKRATGEKRLQPWRTAAECIDWSIPCPSIFLTKEEGRAIGVKRPLAENTMRRIARGVQRYVLDAANPFIIPVTHAGDSRVHSCDEPLRTITTARRGELAVVAPHITKFRANSTGSACDAPLHTITAGGDYVRPAGAAHAMGIVAAFMAQHNTGVIGRRIDAPISTIVGTGSHQQLVASHMIKLRGTCQNGQPVAEPAPTLTAGGTHLGEVRAFLVKYYASARDGINIREPMHTVPTHDRFGLVTVAGEEYRLVDIGMRMLQPRELFRAQGFPDTYQIDIEIDGKRLPKSSQVRMVGNSVVPHMACALVKANLGRSAAEVAA